VQLVADILEPSVRVLVREGAHCVTTARVTEMAGISVGSLYQDFRTRKRSLAVYDPFLPFGGLSATAERHSFGNCLLNR